MPSASRKLRSPTVSRRVGTRHSRRTPTAHLCAGLRSSSCTGRRLQVLNNTRAVVRPRTGWAAQPQTQLRNVVGRRRSMATQQRRYALGPNSRRIVPPLSSTSRLVMTPRIAIGLVASTRECRAAATRYAGGVTAMPNRPGRRPSPRNAFSGQDRQAQGGLRAVRQMRATVFFAVGAGVLTGLVIASGAMSTG